MTYFTNGFDHRFGSAVNFGFDEIVGTLQNAGIPTTAGRQSGPAWRIMWTGINRSEDSSLGLNLAEAGDLHFGFWVKWEQVGGDPGDGLMRLCSIFVNGQRALQVVAAVGNSYAADGLPAGHVGLLDGVDDMGAGGGNLASLTGAVLAVSANPVWPTGSSGTVERHVTCSILRGTGSGQFVMTVDNVIVVDEDTIANLDVAEGDITRLLLAIKSSNTSGNWSRDAWVDDFWVDSVTNFGNARVLAYQMVSQGFYSDGTVTGAATGWEAVSGAPPNLSEYVTVGDGVKDSHVAAEVGDGGRAAVGGVLHRTWIESDFPTKSFVRIDGTDHDVGETPADPNGTAGRVAMRTNPDTNEAWSVAELAALEVGVEGST